MTNFCDGAIICQDFIRSRFTRCTFIATVQKMLLNMNKKWVSTPVSIDLGSGDVKMLGCFNCSILQSWFQKGTLSKATTQLLNNIRSLQLIHPNTFQDHPSTTGTYSSTTHLNTQLHYNTDWFWIWKRILIATCTKVVSICSFLLSNGWLYLNNWRVSVDLSKCVYLEAFSFFLFLINITCFFLV